VDGGVPSPARAGAAARPARAAVERVSPRGPARAAPARLGRPPPGRRRIRRGGCSLRAPHPRRGGARRRRLGRGGRRGGDRALGPRGAHQRADRRRRVGDVPRPAGRARAHRDRRALAPRPERQGAGLGAGARRRCPRGAPRVRGVAPRAGAPARRHPSAAAGGATWLRARRALEKRTGIPPRLPAAEAAARLARRAKGAAKAFERGELAARSGPGALLATCRAADDLARAVGGP
jgi:hypothetical protein